uniref:Uncharacterized protein n=1 Tax=Aegilops tauschii subsp. strangulata TaxID=200361 RepID=A0A453CXP8_AEGTS
PACTTLLDSPSCFPQKKDLIPCQLRGRSFPLLLALMGIPVVEFVSAACFCFLSYASYTVSV